MKKLLLILALTVALPSMAYAKCDGGTEKPGKNGHVYCISNQTMNWWSAFAWCKANERHLATLDEACNNKPLTSCTNLSLGKGFVVWTAIAFETSEAYRLGLNGANNGTSNRTSLLNALCY